MKSSKKKEPSKKEVKGPNGLNGKSVLVDCVKFFGLGVPLTGEGRYLQPEKEPEKEEVTPKEKLNGKKSLVFDGVKFFGLGVPLVGVGKFLPETKKTEEKPEERGLDVLEEPLRVTW